MNFGFSTLGNLKWSLEKYAEELSKAGYGCVEIRGRAGEHLGPEDSPARRAEARRIFESAGLKIAAVTAYTKFVDRAAHAQQADELRTYLPLASELGAEYVRTFGGQWLEGQSEADAVAALAEGLSAVAADAERNGVMVVLETHDGFSRSHTVRDVVARVASPHVRALWDVHHPFRHGETWRESYANLKDGLGCLHIKDAYLMPDGKEQLVLLGAGRVPVREILRQLQQDGFGGPVIVEWEGAWHPELPDCTIAIPQHMAKIREYLK